MSRNLFNVVPGAFVIPDVDKVNEIAIFFECMFFAHAHESTRKIICTTCLAAIRYTWIRFSHLSINFGFPSTRINLSPFTKDFRGGEQLNESLN